MTDITKDWISQTFSIRLHSLDYQSGEWPELKIGLHLDYVTIESGEGEDVDHWLELTPTTRKEANQLSMIFRKVSRRFDEIGKGLV